MVHIQGFDAAAVIPDIPRLLNRGGMNSMMGTLLICFCAITFAGAISLTKSLELIVGKILKFVHSTGSLILATIATGLTMIGVTSNGQVSILMPGEMLREAYIRRGLHPKNLGRTIEDSATIIEPILPWTAAGAYMAGTLGVATLSYLPWAVLCWTGIIFAIIWGFTGFGITKLTPEQQQEMLKEYDDVKAAKSL
jgi:NhaC family Na+:H+ antiporter